MSEQSGTLKALEQFIYNNKELEQLESMFKRFNIFDSLKIANNEIRHSNFLGWLIDPKETHGLDDYFLKELIKNSIYQNSNKINNFEGQYNLPTLFEVDSWNFSNAEVRREYKNIDLLIIDETNKLIIVIENKIWTGQHDNQLTRYKNIVDDLYDDESYKKLFLYLKPDEEEVEEPYLYIGYDIIRATIDKLLKNRTDKMSQEILFFVKHYKSMIERNIMKEAEITKICQTIYNNHKTALDIIFENISSPKNEMADILKEIITEDAKLRLEDSNKSIIRFVPKEIDLDIFKVAQNYVSSNQVIVFEFMNNKESLALDVVVGKVADENQRFKEKICNLLYEQLSKKQKIKLSSNYVHVISETIISKTDYANVMSMEKSELKTYIKDKLKKLGLIEKIGHVVLSNFKKEALTSI